MNGMWAYSSLPVYDRKAIKKLKPSNGSDPPKQLPSLPPERPPPPPELFTHGIASELLGPAIDGPPSPESIRALSKQMRRTSVFDKHHGHQQANSSGSSSLRSLASGDRPSWEHGIEGITLSRKSSGRSTTSSMPTRDRPESVQIFGKTIFSRRGKLRRESSAQSSSSSLYSTELPNEAMPPPPTSAPVKESGAGIFGRRRIVKQPEPVDPAVVERKYQISGPYNFQHVTHTQQQPGAQRTSRMASITEHNQCRAPQAPMVGGSREDLHFADFSSEALPLDDGAELTQVDSHGRTFSNRPPSLMPNQTSPRRLLQRTQSQDQMRVPPPRPPRSPIEPEHQPLGPTPPPRVSSRISMRYDGFDPLASTELERPQTSGGFRHPRPFGLPDDLTSPTISHGLPQGPEADGSSDQRASRVAVRADDQNWPLPCPTSPTYEAALPGVPEEDENTILVRRSRASLTSNSSLRASQSVPLLRRLSLSQSPPGSRRPPSSASETLGRFDLLAAQRALKAALMDGDGLDAVVRESWEDDIDYCYEHEAEADCDYEWERPSLDISRDGESVTPVEADRRPNRSVDVSPTMLTPGQFDMPALSPCSQLSSTTLHEAITPTALALPRASNFSLPRGEASHSSRYLHVRKSSDASSFKESHGFTLSPSLLIPSDFRQQMQAHESEELSPKHNPPYQAPYEEPSLTMDKSTLLIYPRTSASTTGSNETDRSASSERHISTTSASTDFTRLTMSTSSLDFENFIPKSDMADTVVSLPPSSLDEIPPIHARTKSQGNIMPSLPEFEEMSLDQPMLRRADMTHASDPNLVRLAADGGARSPGKRKEPLLTRRRARTTSLSTPPPPGQYALFPSVQISGTRI